MMKAQRGPYESLSRSGSSSPFIGLKWLACWWWLRIWNRRSTHIPCYFADAMKASLNTIPGRHSIDTIGGLARVIDETHTIPDLRLLSIIHIHSQSSDSFDWSAVRYFFQAIVPSVIFVLPLLQTQFVVESVHNEKQWCVGRKRCPGFTWWSIAAPLLIVVHFQLWEQRWTRQMTAAGTCHSVYAKVDATILLCMQVELHIFNGNVLWL